MVKFKIEDYIGKVYGRLTVIGEAEPYISNTNKKYTKAICKCECGVVKSYLLNNLKKGSSTSCGCFQKESPTLFQKTHNAIKTPEYSSWKSMKARCYRKTDPCYPNYGGRGITVQESWINDFQAFFDYIGKRLPNTTLDRIKNDGNYEKGNVRLATPEEQANNRRNSIKYLYKGEYLTKREICNKYNMSYSLLADRLSGIIEEPIDSIVDKPKKNRQNRIN